MRAYTSRSKGGLLFVYALTPSLLVPNDRVTSYNQQGCLFV